MTNSSLQPMPTFQRKPTRGRSQSIFVAALLVLLLLPSRSIGVFAAKSSSAADNAAVRCLSSTSSSSPLYVSGHPQTNAAETNRNNNNINRGGQQQLQPISFRSIYVLGGILLSFNSGYMNGCCLGGFVVKSAKQQSVAAVTGAYTTSALKFASGNFGNYKSQMCILLSFVCGSAIAGALVSPASQAVNLHVQSQARVPHCNVVFLIGSCILLGASVIASSAATPATDLAVFCLTSMANGLQNSLTSTQTSNVIRSTHCTGMSSDIGTYIGQIVLRRNYRNIHKLKLFVTLTASFWIGGYAAFVWGTRLNSSSLLVSAILYAVLGFGIQL